MNRAVKAIEAALQRPVRPIVVAARIQLLGDVPFSGGVASVAGGPQSLGDREAPPIQITAITIATAIFHHMADAGLVRIEPGEQRGASRAAPRGVVEMGETQPAFGQRVEIGGGNISAVTSEIGVADIVGENDDDVRAWRGAESALSPGQCDDRQEEERENRETWGGFHAVTVSSGPSLPNNPSDQANVETNLIVSNSVGLV